MKQFLTVLLFLFVAGFSFETLAVDAFDVSKAGEYAVSPEAVEAESTAREEAAAPIFLFTRSIKSAASEFLHRELGINDVHGQPLPGVLISLLLGAAFGAARKFRARHGSPENDTDAAEALPLAARLLRMHILFLNPPQTIHAISPGPDLFCLRE